MYLQFPLFIYLTTLSKLNIRTHFAPQIEVQFVKVDNLVYGSCVTMEQAKSYSESVVVGRVRGRIPIYAFLKEWAKEQWGSQFEYLSIIRLLEKNWVAFFFK